METNFFHGNIKEILKYAMSLDTKSQKENYLKNIDKDIQKQLNFLDQSIRKEEVKRKSNLWGGRFSVSLRREDKILYKRLKGKILKLLTAIGENPSDRTDELLEQELQSLGQSMNNYSTNQVSGPFDHETQIVTPGFNLVEIPGMKERRERDWKTFYELHENDFVKIMREINGLPQEVQWDALNNFLKKAYSLKKYAEINPESPLNSTVLITKLEKFITNLKKETPEKIETDSSHTRNKEKGPTDTNHQPYKSGEYLQITTKMSEDTFQDFLNDLAEKSFITKETAKSSKEVYHDNFASPRTPCGKMKINWWSGRIGGWGCYHYLFKYGISRSGLFPAEMGYARFFATHFLFDGQEKTEKQVWNGCDSASKTELEKEKKDALNDIIEKYLKR